MGTYRNDAGDLVEWDGTDQVRFGKYAHKAWSEVPDDYLTWLLMGQGPRSLKEKIRLELDRRKAPTEEERT